MAGDFDFSISLPTAYVISELFSVDEEEELRRDKTQISFFDLCYCNLIPSVLFTWQMFKTNTFSKV